ncbi:MAG: pseudouridine synthase, partial [Pseudomonadota bacterium]|nr:pseudouridine synthase [Pseudomonadota bacterium]
MIADGRVALDGTVLDTPATILRTLAGVTVDGQPVAAAEATRLFLYHKPTGLLVTEHDPAGRPTIYDRLPAGLPRLVPVGRLDFNTEGLLLLTTDGALKRQLELPSTGVERAYRARTYGQVSQSQLEDLADGIEIEGMRYGSINANMERRTGANAWIEMILTEGKNREVRRVLEHLELQVSRLIRTRYGPFLLGDLAPGEIGEVKQNDLVNFRKWLDSPKRGNAADEPAVTVDARRAPPPRAPAPTIEPQGRLRVARPPRPSPTRPSSGHSAPTRAAPPRAAPARDGQTRTDKPPREAAPAAPTFQKRGSPRPPLGAKQTSRSAAGRPGAEPRPA